MQMRKARDQTVEGTFFIFHSCIFNHENLVISPNFFFTICRKRPTKYFSKFLSRFTLVKIKYFLNFD